MVTIGVMLYLNQYNLLVLLLLFNKLVHSCSVVQRRFFFIGNQFTEVIHWLSCCSSGFLVCWLDWRNRWAKCASMKLKSGKYQRQAHAPFQHHDATIIKHKKQKIIIKLHIGPFTFKNCSSIVCLYVLFFLRSRIQFALLCNVEIAEAVTDLCQMKSRWVKNYGWIN